MSENRAADVTALAVAALQASARTIREMPDGTDSKVIVRETVRAANDTLQSVKDPAVLRVVAGLIAFAATTAESTDTEAAVTRLDHIDRFAQGMMINLLDPGKD